jgi:hypothetical protein
MFYCVTNLFHVWIVEITTIRTSLPIQLKFIAITYFYCFFILAHCKKTLFAWEVSWTVFTQFVNSFIRFIGTMYIQILGLKSKYHRHVNPRSNLSTIQMFTNLQKLSTVLHCQESTPFFLRFQQIYRIKQFSHLTVFNSSSQFHNRWIN